MQAMLGSLLFRCVLWAVLAATAGGAYLAFKHSIADAAVTQERLDSANESLVKLGRARQAADDLAVNLRQRNREQRRKTDEYHARASALEFQCGTAPPTPELDDLLFDLTRHGVTDDLRRTAERIYAATRGAAVGTGKGKDPERTTGPDVGAHDRGPWATGRKQR